MYGIEILDVGFLEMLNFNRCFLQIASGGWRVIQHRGIAGLVGSTTALGRGLDSCLLRRCGVAVAVDFGSEKSGCLLNGQPQLSVEERDFAVSKVSAGEVISLFAE